MRTVEFCFANGTTDEQRAEVLGNLRLQYSIVGVAGVVDAMCAVQPGGTHSIIMMDNDGSEEVVELLRSTAEIDPQSVKIETK